jgi:hypothetical protein
MPQEEMIRLAGFVAPDEGEATLHDSGASAGTGGQAPIGSTPTASATPFSGALAGLPRSPAAGAAALSKHSAASGDSAAPSTGTLPVGFVGPYRAGAAPPHERWDFFDVCPGVKLLVSAEADPEARRVANEMLALFGPRG